MMIYSEAGHTEGDMGILLEVKGKSRVLAM